MKILINSKLVAKCMNETAKECGMTRLYSSTDNIWQAKANELIGHNFLDNPGKWVEAKDQYRRLVKCYDFLADNFIELLKTKVKAEGFDLMDCEIKTYKRKSLVKNWTNGTYLEKMKNWERSQPDFRPTEGKDKLENCLRITNEWIKHKAIYPTPPLVLNTENAVNIRLTALL
tara:strand:+ start:2003 stop:2521 length:519 start_codon:yes stop_codon:yes gene_type:complete